MATEKQLQTAYAAMRAAQRAAKARPCAVNPDCRGAATRDGSETRCVDGIGTKAQRRPAKVGAFATVADLPTRTMADGRVVPERHHMFATESGALEREARKRHMDAYFAARDVARIKAFLK